MKEIFKLQIPISVSNPELTNNVFIYNEDRSVEEIFSMNDETIAWLLAYGHKSYWLAELTPEGKLKVDSNITPHPDW